MLIRGGQIVLEQHVGIGSTTSLHDHALVVVIHRGAAVGVIVSGLDTAPHETRRSPVDGTVLVGKVQKSMNIGLVGKGVHSGRMDEQIAQSASVDGTPSIDEAQKILHFVGQEEFRVGHEKVVVKAAHVIINVSPWDQGRVAATEELPDVSNDMHLIGAHAKAIHIVICSHQIENIILNGRVNI